MGGGVGHLEWVGVEGTGSFCVIKGCGGRASHSLPLI